jgi:Na+-transporting methylmalonyl-CoA/oxaloacetate decarboxylase gamma subunit
MADFKKTVMGVAIVLLIISLIILGSMMSAAAYEAKWPPHVADCPDFWKEESIRNGDGEAIIQCNNVHNLGSSACKQSMLFSQDKWKGAEGDCRKKTWSKGCDLTWDGITNNSKVCNQDDDDEN